MERRPKGWNCQYTPLMRIGTFVFNKTFPEDVPTSLLFAGVDYLKTRIADFSARKNNHKNRNAIKYYTWWLIRVEHQLGVRLEAGNLRIS